MTESRDDGGKASVAPWTGGWREPSPPRIQLVTPSRGRAKSSEPGTSAPAEPIDAGKSAATLEKANRRAAKAEKSLEKARAAESAALAHIRTLEQTLLERSLADDAVSLGAKLAQTEQELQVFQTARRNAELAVLDVRAQWKDAEARIDKVRQSPAYVLGDLLIESFADWRNLRHLPGKLMAWRRACRLAADAQATDLLPQTPAAEYIQATEIALAKANSSGLAAAEAWVRDQRFRAPVLSRVLLELAKSARKTDPAGCVALARAAVEADPSEGRVRHLAFLLMDTGAIHQAYDVLQSAVAAGVFLNGVEARRYEELRTFDRLRRQGIRLPQRLPRLLGRGGGKQPGAVIYASHSLPYHWNTASMRAHGLAQALAAAGLAVHVVTAPGYPPLREGAKARPATETVEGVTYHRMPAAGEISEPLDDHARKTGVHLGRMARSLNARMIVAPSDLALGYTAAIAARASGAALALDCVALEDGVAPTDYQVLVRDLEAQLMREADAVLVHGPEARRQLLEAGADASRIVETADSTPRFASDSAPPEWCASPVLSRRFVIGYVGDPYEDVDLEALAPIMDHLVARGHDVALLVVGVGTRFNLLKAEIDRLGHGSRALFPGRPRPGAIAAAYGALDAMVAPRRAAPGRQRTPFEVNHALAHGRPVVTNSPDGRGDVPSGCLAVQGGVADMIAALEDLIRAREAAAVTGQPSGTVSAPAAAPRADWARTLTG